MVIKRFENIQAWQEARGLRKLVYAATRAQAFARDLDCADRSNRRQYL